jgi:hypothetical protein
MVGTEGAIMVVITQPAMSRVRSPILLLAIVLLAKTFAGHFVALRFGYAYWVLPLVVAGCALLLTVLLFSGDSVRESESTPQTQKGRLQSFHPKVAPRDEEEAYTSEWVHYLTLACIGLAVLSLLSLITIPVFRLVLSSLPVGI